MVTEEYSYARARARLPLKVTVPSPLVLYGFWSPKHSTAAYTDAFAMFADAAEIGRSEIQELVSLGCEYIQVDAPELATLVDPRVRDWAESLGFGAERMLTEGIDLINAMVEGISGVRLGIHLCRGNNAGMWMASGGYDYIAKALFERATAFDAYFLEYDDARSGSFEPLAGAPDDKQVVLGLVSTKTPELETPQELERAHRRRRAASSRASSSGCRPSAASPRSRRATRSPRPTRSASCGSSPTPPTPPGASPGRCSGSRGPSGFVQEARATLAAMTTTSRMPALLAALTGCLLLVVAAPRRGHRQRRLRRAPGPAELAQRRARRHRPGHRADPGLLALGSDHERRAAPA